MKSIVFAAAVAIAAVSNTAHAGEVIVTGGTGFPTATSWGFFPTENTNSAGVGTTVITSTAPRSGNGSVELRGDRTRFQMGNQYAVLGGPSNLGSLSSITGLSFDWRIAGDSISGYNVDYTPALRLLVQDGNQRSELIWEGVYNNTYGNTSRDTWYSSTFADNFYQFVAGSGVTTSGGSQVNKTLQSWISSNYSAAAYVSGISVGAGSGALSTYHAFADNVTLGTTAGNTTYNFEVANVGAVPEPATWAMMLVGFGGIGFAMRRRKSKVTTSLTYA